MRIPLGLMLLFFFSCPSFATFLPDNDLWKQDRILGLDGSGLTEAEFNQVIEKVYNAMEPSVRLHGGTLEVKKLWDNKTVNAMSTQVLWTHWIVVMYGGLARRPEITPDGFAIVMCHEMGHHLGGYPYVKPIFGWAASEGQADYFATEVCARKVFSEEKVENAKFRFDVDPTVKEKCDGVWKTQDDQNLCYRIAKGSKSLALLLRTLTNELLKKKEIDIQIDEPQFSTPDKSKVAATNLSYPTMRVGDYMLPNAQCRLDTYFNGSLCPMKFDYKIIPGKWRLLRNGPLSEREAFKYSCTAKSFATGARPACWFVER